MKKFLVIMALLCLPLPALAQNNCGNGLPCGSVPWRLPQLPKLASPTPMPTVVLTAVIPTPGPGTPTYTPTAVPTNAPTATGVFDTSGIDSQVATLQYMAEATQAVIYNAEGTPVGLEGVEELGDNAGQFFGYAKGLAETSFGSLSPVISFSLVSMITIIGVKLVTFVLPILSSILAMFKSLIQLIMDFLPL